MVVPKAELFKDKLRLYYTPELLMETLTLSATQGKSVIWTVPPPVSEPKPSNSPDAGLWIPLRWVSEPKPTNPLLVYRIPVIRPLRSRYHSIAV